ncbi:MAG: GNAT family N-acetyltransferase [Candidatus Cloacimonadales bacterium]|nr:GNAT family N-acetyltransferase [Candidatus Cloacimonadales bacterium]
MYKIKIVEPKSKKEFEAYYFLRWQVLRKPWNQPPGTEKDELESQSIHLMAVLNNKVIGCGRGHFITSKQAQIRWMAVAEDFRKNGVGTEILKELEKRIFAKGATEIILKAREKAVSLYQKHGYEIYDDGEIMFGEIMHYWMKKIVIKEKA